MSINDMIVSDYHDKNVDFSASDFTVPNYQLWVKTNKEKNPDDKQTLPAWVGQLIHKASYDTPEVNVIKEFSPIQDLYMGDGEYVSVGGSIDRIVRGAAFWTVEDIKTQGNYPAKSAFKEGGKKEWVTQLSVYRWLLEASGFNMSPEANIHQYVMGYQKDKKLEEYKDYNLIPIQLMTLEDTEEMMKNKIDIATGEEPLMVDCESWRCENYCSYNQSCPRYKENK